MTVSHRWDNAQFIKLTLENPDEFKTGIVVAKFPKTFQDALIVAKRLQISYLWIDSLCIIQASSEGWKRGACSDERSLSARILQYRS